MAKLDPIRYEIFYNKLAQILNEGKEVVRYLSGSTITREAGEVLQGFYTPSGEAALIACGILMHTQNITRCVRYMRDNRYSEDIGIYDGDQFVNNDAYIGGMHVPDTSVLAPFFHDGRQLGWIAAISHTTEPGGIEPGGMCPSAREACHDGIHLPLVKLIEKGKMRRDIFNLALRAVRDPLGMELDLRARIAGNDRVKKRLTELAQEFGTDFFLEAIEQMVNDAEAEARNKFRSLRPGTYTARCYSDCAGAGPPKIMVIEIQMEVTREGELIIRLPVVSPQIAGVNNCYLPATEATIFYTLLVELLYDTRWNSGIARPISVELADNSILSASKNQSVAYCTVGNGAIFCHGLIESISRACYASGKEEEVQAGAGAVVNISTLAGVNERGKGFGNYFMSLTGMGSGGQLERDGIDGTVTVWNPWSYIADNESMEALMPIVMLDYRLRPDSGGFGKYRGGTGLIGTYMTHRVLSSVYVSLGSGAKITSAQGIFGGYPPAAMLIDFFEDTDIPSRIRDGLPIPLTIEEARATMKGTFTAAPLNVPARPMKSGDMGARTSRGGGGLGDPIERDPGLILQDLENKLTTLEVAEKVYCVSIDPTTLKVDETATARLREARRKQRLARGLPGKDYLKLMLERRKTKQLPKPSLDFLAEMVKFSPAFRQELENEEKFAGDGHHPLPKVKAKDLLFKLTPYVNIVTDAQGRKLAVCSQCGHVYCLAKDNYKLFCLIYDSDPAEIYPGRLAHDKDWCVYREFYCPGCGSQVEVEATPPGTPVLNNYVLKEMA